MQEGPQEPEATEHSGRNGHTTNTVALFGDRQDHLFEEDKLRYGSSAATMCRDAVRGIAIAPASSRLTVFREAIADLTEAVPDWLPKNVAVDRLVGIASTHNWFGLDRAEIERMVGAPFKKERIAGAPAKRSSKGRALLVRRASDLQPEKLRWVWPGRIPEGKLVLIGGPPGLGKSQLTTFIGATISNGGAWPCGEGSASVGNVVLLSAEDGVEDTIVPRLIAAGAEMKRIHIVEAATKQDGTGRKTFSLKTDVDLLEAKAKEIKNVRLIVIDPISAYMGGADGNGNVETREVLEPLADMAKRLRIAVVAVTHLNKGGAGTQSALNRFAGSIAFVAAARAAFAVVDDPENDGRRLLLQAKNNLGPKCDGPAFRVEQRVIDDDILTSSVSFENEYVVHSLDEALAASESPGKRDRTSGQEIAEFLAQLLAQGPVDVLEVERQARVAGLLGEDKSLRQDKGFRRARQTIGVVSTREGYGPGSRYLLSIPEAPCAPTADMCAPDPKGARMAELGAHEERANESRPNSGGTLEEGGTTP